MTTSPLLANQIKASKACQNPALNSLTARLWLRRHHSLPFLVIVDFALIARKGDGLNEKNHSSHPPGVHYELGVT